MVARADAYWKGKGSNLSAIDDDVATYAIVAWLVGISTADGCTAVIVEIAHSKYIAAIDGDAAARGVVLAATDGGSIISKRIDIAAVDDERSHLDSTDARIVSIVVGIEFARAVDGQFVALAQLDALRDDELGAFAEIEDHVAADCDALVDGYVFIYSI